MATPVEFAFSLTDEASGPAGKIFAALNRIEAQLKALGAISDPLKNAGEGIRGAGEGAAGSASSFAFASEAARRMTDVVIGLARAMKDLVIDSAKMAIEAVDFRDNSEIAFKALAKSHGYAESSAKLFDDAMRFAAATPFKADMIVSQYQKLMASGFKPVEIPIVLAGATDLAAATGRGAEGVQTLVGAFQRLKNEGKLSGEVLRSFAEAGVNKDALIAQLSKDLGQTPIAIKQMLESGRIDADEGSFAIMKTIRDNISGGQIGDLTAQQSQTLSGLWSTLQSGALTFLSKIDLTPLKNAMKTFAGYLDTSTEKGAALKATLEGFLGGGFAKLGEVLSPANLAAAFDAALGAVRAMKTAFDAVWPYVKAFGGGIWEGMKEAIGPIKAILSSFSGGSGDMSTWIAAFKTLGEVIGAFIVITAAILGGLVAAVVEIGVAITDTFAAVAGAAGQLFAIGSNLVEGLWNGIKAGWATMLEGFKALVDLLPEAVKSALGIHSPSRVFAELGVYTAQGFQEGIEGETPRAQGALQTMVNPDLLRTATGRAGGDGGGTRNSITIEVNGAGDPRATASAVVDALEHAMGMFEDMAMAQGALGAPLGSQKQPASPVSPA